MKIKINNPVKQDKTNTHVKHGVCFVLVHCSWAWGPPWSMVDILSDTPLEKADFPFPSRYQLPIASWLGMGFCLVSTCAGRSGRYRHSLCVFLCAPVLLCLDDCFLTVIHHLCVLQYFCLLLQKDPWVLGEGFDKDISRVEHLKVCDLLCCPIVGLC